MPMNADASSLKRRTVAAIMVAALGLCTLAKIYFVEAKDPENSVRTTTAQRHKDQHYRENAFRAENSTTTWIFPSKQIKTYAPSPQENRQPPPMADDLDYSITFPKASVVQYQPESIRETVSQTLSKSTASNSTCSTTTGVMDQSVLANGKSMRAKRRLVAQHQSQLSRSNIWSADKSEVFSSYLRAPRQCYMAPYKSDDRRRNKNRLRIANFNVDWLFFFGGANNLKHTCPGKCTWKTRGEAWNHIKDIASAIQELDADIIHLTEVEDCRVLGILCDLLGDEYKPYLILGTDSTMHQNVGFISRIDPISDMTRIKRSAKFPVRDSKCDPAASGACSLSKNYVAKFQIENRARKRFDIVVGGAHFRAGINNNNACLRREVQASILTDGVRRRSKPTARIILLGDFNDVDLRLPQLGAHDSRASHALKILTTRAGKNLYNPLIQVHPSKCYTQQSGSALDHILVDPRLRVYHTKIHHHAGRKTMRNFRVSDHYPLVVDAELQ